MKSRTVRRTLTSLVLAAAAMTFSMTGASPAHADVWVGGEYGHTNVNCDRSSHLMTITAQMTMYTPMPTTDDGSILTPPPAPAYHRYIIYSWTTKTWSNWSMWYYTPGSKSTVLTSQPGYFKVYVQYAWALKNNPSANPSDWLIGGEYLVDDYSHFPYLTTWTRGWCLL
jgi:hypothetical protein